MLPKLDSPVKLVKKRSNVRSSTSVLPSLGIIKPMMFNNKKSEDLNSLIGQIEPGSCRENKTKLFF